MNGRAYAERSERQFRGQDGTWYIARARETDLNAMSDADFVNFIVTNAGSRRVSVYVEEAGRERKLSAAEVRAEIQRNVVPPREMLPMRVEAEAPATRARNIRPERVEEAPHEEEKHLFALTLRVAPDEKHTYVFAWTGQTPMTVADILANLQNISRGDVRYFYNGEPQSNLSADEARSSISRYVRRLKDEDVELRDLGAV